MKRMHKKPAPRPEYVSESQLVIVGFETPFAQKLNPYNRWVLLAKQIPWDEVCNIYLKQVGVSSTGRPAISPRIVIGSLIIKHLCNLDDRETVDQISENMYMQYFLGFSSFSNEAPFDASLFVEFRKRLGINELNEMNLKIFKLYHELSSKSETKNPPKDDSKPDTSTLSDVESIDDTDNKIVTHKGRVLFDATACPQNIAYPTDINLLSSAREKSEEIIDKIFNPILHLRKPRTYREVARKEYLRIAQNKNKSRTAIRKGIRKQLGFLGRNIKSIHKLLDKYDEIPLNPKEHKYLLVIQTHYQQQKEMYDARKHSVADRIVSIHQPHVRPIVRGKAKAKTEFGAKIHASLVDGFTFLDELSWDTFNEGVHLPKYVEQYKERFGYYPAEILADQIYCNRENRRQLKEMGIKLLAKPLGRPSAVKKEYVRPGERNPIEGKFGQAKTAYGLGNIKARLKETSESWIASIFLVLNLVKLAGVALLCLFLNNLNVRFSAWTKLVLVIKNKMTEKLESLRSFLEQNLMLKLEAD